MYSRLVFIFLHRKFNVDFEVDFGVDLKYIFNDDLMILE